MFSLYCCYVIVKEYLDNKRCLNLNRSVESALNQVLYAISSQDTRDFYTRLLLLYNIFLSFTIIVSSLSH